MSSFKPERTPFMWPRILAAVVGACLLSVALLVLAVLTSGWVAVALPLVWGVLVLPAAYGAHVAYTKEEYTLEDDRLIRSYGGMFSDGRNELDIRNITHVRLRLPWPRHPLFGIGDVRVESAGSAQAEVTFASVKDPEALYSQIQEKMRANGYALGRKEVLHQESPSPLGAIADIGQVALGLVFAGVWLGGAMIGIVADAGPSLVAPLLGLAGVGSAVLGVAGAALRYLDVTRRTYTVYDDTVEYTEGFLTRDNAFIPFENIADAGVNRTVVDQVFGLYDVAVSCQGSGSEVKFRKLTNGPAMQEAVSQLVASARLVDKTKPVSAPAKAGEATEAKQAAPKPAREVVSAEDAWTADLQMNVGSVLMGTLPMLLTGPVWLLIALGTFIRASKTRYRVGVDAISSDFSFIGSNTQQFAFDKVTGVQVHHSPIHNAFGTVSIHIWSIGAPRALVLNHVDASSVNLPALLRQCGIVESPAEAELAQSFGAKVWAIQNATFFAFLALVALVCVVATPFLSPLVLVVPMLLAVLPLPSAVLTKMRTERQRFTLHASHVETQTGIWFCKHTYARYDSVKKVESIAVPFTDQGRFRVYIAGEQVIQQGQNGTRIIPYLLEGAYIEGIHDRVDAMDALLLGRIAPADVTGAHPQDDDLVRTAKPAIANNALVLGVVSVFIWPLVLVLAVRVWQLRVAQYAIESDRVVYRHGILFKTVTSVLFDRIDALQQNQGALGKMFSNGSVTLLTAGSSAPDLVIGNVAAHGEVYATIREGYGR